MKEEVFDDIMRSIQSFNGLSMDCAHMLIKKYKSISESTLHNILGEAVTLKVIRFKKLKIDSQRANILKHYEAAIARRDPPGIIVRLAASVGMPPVFFAKLILENYVQSVDKKVVNRLMKDTTLINDGFLAYEIFLSTLYDDKYGYISNTFSHTVGNEYEEKLKHILIERNIPFYDEVELRGRGYDKTPDFKLKVPIAVDGFVINWIESKARFGSSAVHRSNAKDQYHSYWNRFGPGLVIYWYDFVDTLSEPNEKRYIIRNDFPENVTYINVSSLLDTEPCEKQTLELK